MRGWQEPGWWVMLVCGLAIGLTACNGSTTDEDSGECVDDRTYFQTEVWPVVKNANCMGCHSQGGDAQTTKFVLQPEQQTGFIDANMTIMRDVAAFEKDGTSVLLLKPSAAVSHDGGKLFGTDSEEYAKFQEMVDRFEDPVTCGESTKVEEHFDGVVMMTPEETLRKATLNLNGRLPTAAEEFRVATGGMEALDVELDRIMREDAFSDRLEVIFNDMFLVDRYVGGNEAVDLLNTDYYPDARWYIQDDDDPRDYSNENQEFLEGARMYTNDAVARAPLHLATYLVENDLPFTEIVTADYMVVNPYSARAYGITDLQWEDPLDPEEFQPGRIPGHPHAGVLSDPMWLNRFPTTDTNRNRHRSRMVYWFFLATDVLKLAERPVDVASINDFNPTVNNVNCSVCHTTVDPVAGMLQNWDEDGSYNPREEGWYPEMWAPGFEKWDLPYEQRTEASQLLGQRIAADRRFATSMVHHMYRGLTGQEPLHFPTNATDPKYEEDLLQYEIQDRQFDKIAQKFIDTNYNLKTVFKELIKSPYFRAKDHTSDDAEKLAEVGELGTGRLLTPELLDDKIVAVTGQRWADGDGNPYMLQEDWYMILYGGIDSDDVTKRIDEPNGIMSGIQYRMANEMACRTTARDFTQTPEKRRYFPFVEPSMAPRDQNGFTVEEADAAIRKNIQYLHWHILGERLDANDPEIERTYNLFVQTWEEGSNKMGGEEVGPELRDCGANTDVYGVELPEDQRITQDENYTIRAWMAVVTYLLSDYKFLFE